MDRGKSLVVALTRFYGAVMVYYGVFYATYLRPYYVHYVTVYGDPGAHGAAARAFWAETLHSVLRVLVGLVLMAQADGIIASLRPRGENSGFRPLVVALVKLNGFILLFYSLLSAIDALRFFSNTSLLGWHAFLSGGPVMLRTCLDFLAGFLVVARAEQVLGLLEPRPIGESEQSQSTAPIT